MPTASEKVLVQLRRHESRNILFTEPDGTGPIVWDRARGCQVVDLEGRRYLDLTAAFGVAAAGHANPAVVRAARKQMGRLVHAMGDVHPHPGKARLASELSRLTYGRWSRRDGVRETGKVIFGSSGFEAVEAALKTARLATGRPGIIAFEGGYHGLGYGALNGTQRSHFREPFRDQLREFGTFLPFPETASDLALLEPLMAARLADASVGAVLVEPMQARGGIRIPPAGFLRMLRRLADASGRLLILDEIYTGFGRTGAWFACEHEAVVPDLICLGKALTGGFPLSACVGRAQVMDAWPPSDGEAVHTSTYLGHPVGCAMALAQVAELERLRLPARSKRLGTRLRSGLEAVAVEFPHAVRRVSVSGLMGGIEFRAEDGGPGTALSLGVMRTLLRRGFIVLPEGAAAEVIGFTPPLTIGEVPLQRALDALAESVRELLAPVETSPTGRAARRRAGVGGKGNK
jgi:4-aminobutyrate aminotransferase-like enzyme